MTVRRRLGSILTTFLLVGFVGCGDDTPTGINPDDLIGTWVATSLTFTEIGGTGTYDDIAAGGSLTIVIRSDLTYSLTQVIAGPPPENYSETGMYTVNGNVFTATPDGEGPDLLRVR